MLVRYRKAIVFMVLFCLFSCTSCGVKQNTDKQEVKKKITWEGDYPYANSTDIFCVEKNNLFSYDINGENKRKLKATMGEGCLIRVTDEWLYFKKEIRKNTLYEIEIEAVCRIPLKKGRDGRSVLAGKEQNVVDHLDGVTEAIVVDKYLVYLRSASCVNYNNSLVGSYIIQQEDEIFLVDLKNNKTKKCIVPKEITSLKILEWQVFGSSSKGIVWGEEALFYYDIKQNKVSLINEKQTSNVAFDPLKDEVYYCKENCSQIIEKYSIKTGEKSAIITKKEVLPVLVNCLCVSMDDIKKFSIEELYYSKEKIYFSVKTKVKGGYNREVLLSYQVNKNLVLYEPELDNAKHLYLPWNEKHVFMILLGCVQGKWFWQDENGLLKYDSKTGAVRLCDRDGMDNEIYAIKSMKELRKWDE